MWKQKYNNELSLIIYVIWEVTDLNIAGSKGNTNITDNKFCCKGGEVRTFARIKYFKTLIFSVAEE